ncbi:MAG: transcription-repair coupling factor [Cyanobacteriota bacterium]
MDLKTEINTKNYNIILQHAFLDNLKASQKLHKIKQQLFKNKTNKFIYGINDSIKSLLSAYFADNISYPLLLITSSVSNALKLQSELLLLLNIPVKYLPSLESSPYDMVYSSSNSIKSQLDCVELLINKTPCIIIISAKTLNNTFLSPEDYIANSININLGDELDTLELAKKLTDLGYSRVPMVMDPGEYSLRGDICDIFPISSDPVRIEFAFDEVESIRFFNINSQRSVKTIERITIRPRYKVILNRHNLQNLVDALNLMLQKPQVELDQDTFLTLEENINNLIIQLKEFNYFEGIEYFAPYLHNKMASILDYLPEQSIIILDEFYDIENQIINKEKKLEIEYHKGIKSGRLPSLPYSLHIKSSEVIAKIQESSLLYLNSIQNTSNNSDESIEIYTKYVPCFLSNLKNAANYLNDLKKDNYKILITTEYPQRVKSVFSEWDCHAIYLSEETENETTSEDIIITKHGLTSSFTLPEFKIASITDKELFGKRSKKPTISKKTSQRENLDFYLSPSDLQENDFVVHARHGVGKFVQLLQMAIDNQYRDYLMIQYFNNDKLYVPVDQINLITRYRGSGDKPPKLSKMGGLDWEGTKKKAQKAVETIAADLLNLYAQRAKTDGFIFEPDTNWQMEMEDSFEFVETPDQMQSILDVKFDMESDKPMDRLICGDVGYGKTEVAIRSIFKAVLSGKQVAFLVPTTVLAQQHFNVITERFLPYPINIAMLSRFRTNKEQKETINRLITGECDIVIGTHRLLQKDVGFKNLGLVVIDEEHRFGVNHKEKLKTLRTQVDVISMSATPIPRTLYMAMSGIRDMSVINTPPVNRSPVKTFVGEYNEKLIRSAILRELEREGQVYYVHNRVQSIHRVAHDLSQLVPEAKIAIAHGQMKEKELETVMLDFSVQKYDILLCTTIIESGLDIPNVNSIIIEDSDMMGLAQLYQLRGRVGRCDRQAFAYCFYQPKKLLTDEAKKRLMAIREFNTLGSGYQVALRDLEIRGIGNILGHKQHGRMVEIGFDLYCEMLEEAVKKLKGQEIVKKYIPIVDINITAFIPDSWIGDKEQKIVEYKRLAAVESQRELEIISDEWNDRFGKIPEEVNNLIKITRIRLLAADVAFNIIREEKEFVRIFTNYNFNHWKKLTQKLPSHLVNRTKWIKMPETSMDGISAILIKYRGFTPKQLLNFIEELCLSLYQTIQETRGENN